MTRPILLMSSLEDTYLVLHLACHHLPARIIHTRDTHSSIVVARSCDPSIIFIDATDTLSYNGWVMARLIKMDNQFAEVPVIVLSDDVFTSVARKSPVDCQLPRCFSVPEVRSLIQQYLSLSTAQSEAKSSFESYLTGNQAEQLEKLEPVPNSMQYLLA